MRNAIVTIVYRGRRHSFMISVPVTADGKAHISREALNNLALLAGVEDGATYSLG